MAGQEDSVPGPASLHQGFAGHFSALRCHRSRVLGHTTGVNLFGWFDIEHDCLPQGPSGLCPPEAMPLGLPSARAAAAPARFAPAPARLGTGKGSRATTAMKPPGLLKPSAVLLGWGLIIPVSPGSCVQFANTPWFVRGNGS